MLANTPARQFRLVVAPAGFGKTTLLSQVASDADVPCAWYRADQSDGSRTDLLRHLESAVTSVLPDMPRGWTSAHEAAAGLDSADSDGLMLIIDDLHALYGTQAEAELEQLIGLAPPSIRVLAATRRSPNFNLSRLRVSGELVEISAEDLRFRVWEVEQLFRDFYDEPLGPLELAALARRTEGWAAGLQLFHLATSGKPATERARTLSGLRMRSGLVREYLARNVLDEMSDSLREFLVGTSVLGRLSGAICDEFLGVSGSKAVLEELERRQFFTFAIDDGDAYRYHEVLRAHLEASLVEQIGEQEVRARFLRAGRCLERAGALSEAVQAYWRADDRDAATRLLEQEGSQLLDQAGEPGWLEPGPTNDLLKNDPWIQLAAARRARADGLLLEAIARYRRAEEAPASAPVGHLAESERRALTVWTAPASHRTDDWAGLMRAAVTRSPGREALRIDSNAPHAAFASGLSFLLAGRVEDADSSFKVASAASAGNRAIEAGISVGRMVAALMAGRGCKSDADRASEDAEQAGLPWLVRLSRVIAMGLEASDHATDSSHVFREAKAFEGDAWGEGIAALLLGFCAPNLWKASALRRAESAFVGLGAGVLAAWCRSAALLRDAPNVDRKACLQAAGYAHSLEVPGAEAIAYLALQQADPDRAASHRATASMMLHDLGLAPTFAPSLAEPSHDLEIRCFGGFAVLVSGRALDLSSLRPRARALLRYLSLRAGRAVHREHLLESLWPEVRPDAGHRSLQVAISSIRQALDSIVAANGVSIVAREGQAYRLATPPGTLIDVLQIEAALDTVSGTLAAGDIPSALAAFHKASDIVGRGLLPEDGPAEWAIPERERFSQAVVQAALDLISRMDRDADYAADIARVCEKALGIDRYSDQLWRSLICSLEHSNQRAAARRAKDAYQAVLTELGIAPSTS